MVAMARTLNALIVDDDRGVRSVVGDVLAMAGHHPLFASSGQEAQDLIRETPVHFSILDIHIRSDNGLVVLLDLRRILEDLPAIFMSAAFTPQIRADARALGAQHCLDKPLDVRALRRAVHDLIDLKHLQ